jgi:DNA-binding response OmpR family regulator
MALFSYDTTDVVVHDPVADNRSITRAALYSIGFRRVEAVGTLKDFEDTIRRHSPDLAICEARGRESDPCRTIQGLRQDVAAFNPFTLIIVTAWNGDGGFVRKVVDSGPDDLILRPFSTNTLANRIEAHARRRKDFVATIDYIGPDRREIPDRAVNTLLISPPNSLRMKAIERMSPEDASLRLGSELKTARQKLNDEKLRRDSFHICVLWHLLQEIDPEMEGYTFSLDQIKAFTYSVSTRARHAGYAAAAEPCNAIFEALGRLQSESPTVSATETLITQALQLLRIFHDDSTDQLVAEIEAAVANMRMRFRLRQASLAPAQPDESSVVHV